MSTAEQRQKWARLAEHDDFTNTWGTQFRNEAITALLADVDRLTGDNAALSEALDTALLHLKESEADRDAAVEQSGHYEAEVMICHGLLEGLTPGGSEFYNSPERCAEWAMDRMRSVAKVAKERNELRKERDALAAELATVRAQLDAVPEIVMMGDWFDDVHISDFLPPPDAPESLSDAAIRLGNMGE
jgi:hypothetical protein